jgi:hypothetical protein
MFTVGQALPEFAAELIALLEKSTHAQLAPTVRDLPIVDRCRCGQSDCGHFYTAPRPRGPYGPGHSSLRLDVARGLVVIDIVGEVIVGIEVLGRRDVAVSLGALMPVARGRS